MKEEYRSCDGCEAVEHVVTLRFYVSAGLTDEGRIQDTCEEVDLCPDCCQRLCVVMFNETDIATGAVRPDVHKNLLEAIENFQWRPMLGRQLDDEMYDE